MLYSEKIYYRLSKVFHTDSLETNDIQSASLQSLPEV